MAHLKLDRAREHLAELTAACSAWVGSISNELVHGRETETGVQVWRLPYVEPPDRLTVLAGDFLNNTRPALDYAVTAAYLANGGDASKRHTAFPIEDTPSKYRKAAGHRLRGVPQRVADIVEEAQPFRATGGPDGHGLAILAHLTNADKHRSTGPFRMAAEEIHLDSLFITARSPASGFQFRVQNYIGMPVEQAQILAFRSEPIEAEFDVTMKRPLSVTIALGAAPRCLHMEHGPSLIDGVSAIVDEIEAAI